MKRIILGVLVCLFAVSMALAQGEQANEAAAGTKNPEMKESGAGQGEQVVVAQNEGGEPQPREQMQGTTPGVGDQARERARVKTGSYTTANGKQIQIQEQANNRLQLNAGGAAAQTALQMSHEQGPNGTRLRVALSNGKNAEVKVMPDRAAERALERLRLRACSAENGCSIELKEVGEGEQAKAAYELRAQRQTRVLGLFRAQMQVEAQVDAENGEVIRTKKPWWAFLASEPEE